MTMSEPPQISAEQSRGHLHLRGFGRPFGIERDHNGNTLIADMDLHGIVRLAPDYASYDWLGDESGWSVRQTIRTDAKRAAKRIPARFNGPHSVACGDDNRLFVTTYYDPALMILASNGTSVSRITRGQSFSLEGPATGVFSDSGQLLVAEYALHCVLHFDAEGKFFGTLGGGIDGFQQTGNFKAGNQPGFFDRPHMAVVDREGDILVADTWNHRIQRFSGDGRFKAILGGLEPGWRGENTVTPDGNGRFAFHAPVAISVTEENGLLVTDWGNNRLKWYDGEGHLIAIEDNLGLDKPYDAKVFGKTCIIANSHRGEVIVRQN